jgi:peptide/nickel transport system permease protein
MVVILGIAAAAPVLGLPDPIAMNVAERLTPSSASHLLGQDLYGRDVLSRIIWGAQTSLTVALAASALAGVAGTTLGVIGGYFRGIAEIVSIRMMDVILCFPPLLLALLVVTVLGPGAATLVPVLALVFLPGFTRVAYSGVLTVRSQDYVNAMRALGAGRFRIMLRTIVPNVMGPILVQFSLAMATAVVLESGLSFLGLGAVPPTPSWGLMIGEGRTTMNAAPWLLVWPCLALTLTIFVMNALCDGIRDWVDPNSAPRKPVLLLRPAPAQPLASTTHVLDVRGLTIAVESSGILIPVVRDVSFAVQPSETVAIVGESGSGKSLTSLAVMGLLPSGVQVVAGHAWLGPEEVLGADEKELTALRGAEMAMIFQDPSTSLNPVQKVGRQIADGIRVHQGRSRRDASREAVALMLRVGIPDSERRAKGYPHEMSGGMRQRIVIAMAVANNPRLLIADEPTTALDVTIQAQILDLLAKLRRDKGIGLLFITHSLPVVAEIADRVLVMYAGEIVEEGPVAEVFRRPLHHYTAALLRGAPKGKGHLPEGIPGSVPPPSDLPPGCVFAPRCPARIDACDDSHPILQQVQPSRASRCIRWAEL